MCNPMKVLVDRLDRRVLMQVHDRYSINDTQLLGWRTMKKKKAKTDKKKLLLSTQKVRDLKPVDKDELEKVAGGDPCSGSGTLSLGYSHNW